TRVAVHRQCGDDRLGGCGTLRRQRVRFTRCACARSLAARRTRREGARRRCEGMKIGIIGGGAWGTALAQVASAGGRETLLWAIEDDVIAAINRIHQNPIYLPGLKLDPAIRA